MSTHLNITQLDKIQQILLEKINKTKTSIVDYKELTKPIGPENAIGRISRMDAINNKSINEAALRNAKNKLIQLHRAQKEITGKSFGVCKQCGGQIEYEKLLVLPESFRCISCVKNGES